MAQLRFNPVAIGVAASFTLAAVTAVAVAPRGAQELPAGSLVVQAVSLDHKEVNEPVDSYLQSERARRGDTLSAVLARMGAVDSEFLDFVASNPVARKAQHLRHGRTVSAEIDSSGRVMRFSYRISGADDLSAQIPNPLQRPGRRITVTRDEDRFMVREENVEIERLVESRVVEFDRGYFASTEAAGVPESVAGQVDDIFGSELDLRAIKRGDSMKIVYESFRERDSLDAEIGGRVLSVVLNTQGKQLEAAWYERALLDGRKLPRPKGEYYTLAGTSLKRSFLRNPLETGQVMSGYSEARLHPVAREWRAHKGVDFAAPIGTPVRSVGDGTIEFVGQQRGYGNVIIVKHHGHTTTLYAHLNEFAESLKPGSRVNQGEIVGFVGQTGMATGPHLHYEFRIKGEQTDPMTVALPQSQPFDPYDRKRFTDVAGSYRERLTRLGELRLARFE